MKKGIDKTNTALFVAYLRGYHSKYDSQKIFDDYLANELIGKETCEFYEKQYTNPNILRILEYMNIKDSNKEYDKKSILSMVMQHYSPLSLPVSRSRYTEDILEESMKKGICQYILLGSGLDTFSFRKKSLLDKLEVFEVDDPNMQEYKRERLNELGWSLSKQVHFIPVNFLENNISETLQNYSYNPKCPSLFSWLGVTYFLTEDVIFDTLSSIVKIAQKGSIIIFDYIHKDAFIPEKSSLLMQLGLRFRKEHGEPWITGFEPSDLAERLSKIGLRVEENLAPNDIQELFFKDRSDSYHAYEHAHFLKAIVE